MNQQRRSAPWITATLVALLALTSSCSDKPTNPGNGSGGVGTRELDSGNLLNGEQYMHTFANSGTFGYHCTIHPGMTGSVTVVGGAAMAASVTITDFQFTPSTVSVAPGGTVTWTNNGATAHTVTSN